MRERTGTGTSIGLRWDFAGTSMGLRWDFAEIDIGKSDLSHFAARFSELDTVQRELDRTSISLANPSIRLFGADRGRLKPSLC